MEATRTIACIGAAIILAGCATEERVVRYRPILASVPGAQSSMQPVGPRFEGEFTDPTQVPSDELVLELPDGTKKLKARTGRHLMAHIINTIDAGDDALFVEQVLSERTKAEFYKRGLDPTEAFRQLKKRREDILKLFNQIPMGEYTPGIYMRGVGGGVQRIKVPGPVGQDLRWNFMDMVMEGGNWRLRWFGKD